MKEGREKGKEPKEERHVYQGAKKPPEIRIISCVFERTLTLFSQLLCMAYPSSILTPLSGHHYQRA
jgi:hypothetical protein